MKKYLEKLYIFIRFFLPKKLIKSIVGFFDGCR